MMISVSGYGVWPLTTSGLSGLASWIRAGHTLRNEVWSVRATRKTVSRAEET